MPIELHCHSTASDGRLTPTQLVERALSVGLTTLALTDHDTVGGVEEAIEAARELSLRIVPGVELSCHFEEREIHLLGYFLEHRDPDFLELLERSQKEREQRAHEILDKLKRLNVELTYEQVLEQSSGGVIGRPHIARVLIAKGHARTMDEAFDRYLGRRAPAYVGRRLLSLEDGIEAIRRAGGCSVLAHPGVLGDWALVERILQLPISGVEVWHPSHDKPKRKRAKRLGGRYQKVLTGGSDFHGPEGNYHDLGSAAVTEQVVSKLYNAARGGKTCV